MAWGDTNSNIGAPDHSGLPIRVDLTFSLGVTAEVLRANIDWKSAKFPRNRGRPTRTIFAQIDRPVNALQLCR